MPKQILLVEDSVTIHKMVQITFAREDVVLTACKNADEAITKAHANRPDVVLVDAGLAGKNGYEFCALLRQDPQLQGVACLLLTGNASPYDEAKGSRVGVDGYIVKPFETQALIDKVSNVAGARPTASMAAVAAPPPPAAPPIAAAPPPAAPSIAAAPAPRPTPAATLGGFGTPPPPARMPPPAAPPATTSRNIAAPDSPTLVTTLPSAPAAPPPAAPPRAAAPQAAAPQAAAPQAAAPQAAAPHSAAKSPPQMPRPSLIPHTPTPSPVAAAAPARPAPRATLMGIPTVPAGMAGPGAAPSAAVWQQPSPAAAPKSEPPIPQALPRVDTAPIVANVTSQAQQVFVAGSADQAAVAAMSREIIERIAWEIVPELAETIIREQLDRLVRERQGG